MHRADPMVSTRAVEQINHEADRLQMFLNAAAGDKNQDYSKYPGI